MAKKLIPEELDLLIQEFLTDGILTDKERQVVLKKAEGMGLDRDEIDLYLDAQVQKIDQVTDAAVRKRKSKECPYCGAPVPQLADKCPECGQFITPEASKDLQDILENLEDALVNMKSREDVERNKAIVERYARKAKLYYSNNPKIKPLLAEIEIEMEKAEKFFASEAKKEALLKGANSFLNGTLKNKWFWAAMPYLLALILFIKCQSYNGKVYNVYEGNPRDSLVIAIVLLMFLGTFGLMAAAGGFKNKE